MNLLTTVKGNVLSFYVNHIVDGEVYELSEGERYSFNVSKSLSNDVPCIAVKSDTVTFKVDTNSLDCGSYYFEIGIVSSSGVETIISPATDKDGNRVNTLIITERINK